MNRGASQADDAPAVFYQAIESRVPQVLGMLDREPYSVTYGCLDRTYWAWKFTDFPGARFQEGLCALSYLYATPHEGSPYYGSPRLRRWISAGIDYWIRLQRSSGDFDEAYPFERSLAATAFTTFYISEAWHFLEGDLPSATRDGCLRSLERAGSWLLRNDETHGFLSNHLAAAAGALLHVYRITEIERFEARAGYFLDKILSHQSSEGWYEEYGGADPGYQTHGSFYLARCLELGGDAALRDSLERSFRFLAHFVHPDGSLGGEYASRNTQTYYPAAFEMLAASSGVARWIADRMRPSVSSLAAAGLGSVDPYNLFPLLNNYVFAHRAAVQRGDGGVSPESDSEAPGRIHFRQAGLLVERRPRYDLYVSLSKGGVLKLFDRAGKRLVGSDCGWIGRLRRGAVLASQWSDPDRRIDCSADRITVEGTFMQVSRPVMKPWTFLLFRLFMLTVGRFPGVAARVKRLLVSVLIYRKRGSSLRITRTITLLDDGVEIRDRLSGSEDLVSIERGDFFATIHMGSSRYFVPHELSAAASNSDETVHSAELESGVERVRRMSIG